MRLILSSLVLLFSLSNCGSRTTETNTTTADASDSASTTASKTTCFRQLVGRDTTSLSLTIKNDSTVSGELSVLPFEKDRAVGPVTGTLENDQIRAEWQRSDEGVTQPYEVVFTMKGDSVMWREGERVEKQGKWMLKNPDQGYQYVLTKVDCNTNVVNQ